MFGWTSVIVLFLMCYKSALALRQRYYYTLLNLLVEMSRNNLHSHQQISSFIRYYTQ